MTYATEIVHQYRFALRYLWNVHLWGRLSTRDERALTEFEALKLPVFRALVASVLEPEGAPAHRIFGSAFRVVPPVHLGVFPSVAVDVAVEKGTTGKCFDEIPGPFAAADVRFTLLDFFDWDLRNWRDLRYYLVRIDAFKGRPESIGREALIDTLIADVVWNVEDL